MKYLLMIFTWFIIFIVTVKTLYFSYQQHFSIPLQSTWGIMAMKA